jgi:hypothetical protein
MMSTLRTLQPNQNGTVRRNKKQREAVSVNDNLPLEFGEVCVEIGPEEFLIEVPPDRDRLTVRAHLLLNTRLSQLAAWLAQRGATKVALACTGFSWSSMYSILNKQGINPSLLIAGGPWTSPERPLEWHDRQRIHWRPAAELLRALRPDEYVGMISDLSQHRDDLATSATHHLQVVHERLNQLNVPLKEGISDLTVLAIVEAMMTENSVALAGLLDRYGEAQAETSAEVRAYHWNAAYLLSLQQAWECYEIYQRDLADYEEAIEQLMCKLRDQVESERRVHQGRKASCANKEKKRLRKLTIDLRTDSYNLFGIDITQITGFRHLASGLGRTSEAGSDAAATEPPGRLAKTVGSVE